MATNEGAHRRRRALRAAAALALVVVIFGLGRLTAPGEPGAGDHDHAHDHEDEDETIYYCSMHPDQQSTDPDATCPICGMDMIPMPEDEHPEEADLPVLRAGARAQALLDVEVAPVERRGVSAELDIQGTVALDETRLHDVVARSDGFVESQQADYKWQLVRRGQALASIYSPAVTAAARELLVIARRAADRGGGVRTESGEEKLRRLGAPESYIREVLDTGEVPRTYTLRSPADGVITSIDGREGHAMQEGERHVQIADLSTVWVQLDAYEDQIARVSVGDAAQIRARAHPGRTYEGEVSFIDPAVDDETRTARLRVEVDNADGALKPGMYVRARVTGARGGADESDADAPLVIPRSAPLLTGNRAIVYVQERDGDQMVYEGRDVELGSRSSDVYEVESGLEEGETVVARGAFRIDSELQIRSRPSMMAPADVFAQGAGQDAPGAALADVEADSAPEAFVGGAGDVMDAYFELTAALADDDLGRAQQAVLDMREALDEVDAGGLEGAAQGAWEDVSLGLAGPLADMEAASDLEGLREALEAMAPPAEQIAGLLERVADLEVYRGTCPMTPGGTGHWLQRDDDIKNPYMGHEMLSCGTIDSVTP